MNGSAAAEPPKLSYRATALLALTALSVLIWLQPPWLRRIQAAWFDSMQAACRRRKVGGCSQSSTLSAMSASSAVVRYESFGGAKPAEPLTNRFPSRRTRR